MQILLAGALPDPRTTRELLPHLTQAAPNLVDWLGRSRATRIVADPALSYCTTWEYWQLHELGFRPQPDQAYGAGLGPLHVQTSGTEPETEPDQAVWLLELGHIAPARDGAALIPARVLDITPEQSEALFVSAEPLFEGTGFTVRPSTTTHWRVTLPNGYAPVFPSPELVGSSTVHDWWRQDITDRPWRRLANELQMLWFDHPVNQQRVENGVLPINSVWLYGGARPDQFPGGFPVSQAGSQPDLRLREPTLAQDWSRWLEIMTELDTQVFASLDRGGRITLTGQDRIVTHTAEHRPWKRWLPGKQEAWKKWWSYQD